MKERENFRIEMQVRFFEQHVAGGRDFLYQMCHIPNGIHLLNLRFLCLKESYHMIQIQDFVEKYSSIQRGELILLFEREFITLKRSVLNYLIV